jgi:hypothetical protein
MHNASRFPCGPPLAVSLVTILLRGIDGHARQTIDNPHASGYDSPKSQHRRYKVSRTQTHQRGMATALVVVLVAIGVVVIGAVVAGVVLLANPLTISVTNKTSGTFDVAKGSAALNLNFLPAINIPSEIKTGETATIQVPRRFVQSASISPGSVRITAFSRDFAFSPSGIDMQRSTLDGQPLSSYVGKMIDTSKDHTLIIQGR